MKHAHGGLAYGIPVIPLPLHSLVLLCGWPSKTAAQSLRSHLALDNLPLATTKDGKDFCIKALHPADGEIKSARAPGTNIPTVSVACDMVETFRFPENATRMEIIQSANPAVLASVIFYDDANSILESHMVLNKALGLTGIVKNFDVADNVQYKLWLKDLLVKVKRIRVLSQCITGQMLAPALKDQGTILSGQVGTGPKTMQLSSQASGGLYVWPDVWGYDIKPAMSQLLMGTSAYSGEFKHGFYQPLKFDGFKWRSPRDLYYQVYMSEEQCMTCYTSAAVTQGLFPIAIGDGAVPITTDYAMPLIKPSSKIAGFTVITGTSGFPDAAIRLRFRQTVEMVPTIGGTYAALSEVPPPPDDLCYKMYLEVSSRMKDAYPASYNDLGSLRKVIMKIGKQVLKYADPILDILQFVPGVGQVVPIARSTVDIARTINQSLKTIKAAKKGKAVPIPPPVMKSQPKSAPKSRVKNPVDKRIVLR